MLDASGRKRSEGPPPSPPKYTTSGDDLKLALRLYDVGFNVVPVSSKMTLCSWSPRERVSREELRKLLPKATGIALVGGLENPFKPAAILVVVDVDRPSTLERYPSLKGFIERTVSWYTGPRCPRCEEKHLEVIESGRSFKCPRCNTEFTISEAKRGLGALFTVDLETYERYLKGSRRFNGIEFLVNNYQLIPPSLHPSGVRYKWVKPIDLNSPNYGIYALVEAEVRALFEGLSREGEVRAEVVGEAKEVGREGLRELSDGDLLRIKELLREAYRPGVRQYLVLFLSGWMAKAGISPISAIKLVKMLYDESGDTDPLKNRLSAVVYSYKKVGIDIDRYVSEIERLAGVRPYGLEKEISEEHVKGKSGLQEILEDVLGEERALAIIKELEDILGASSPWRDSIIELLDYERQLYAVANLRKLVLVRAKLDGNRLVYKERVAVVAPTKVVVYDNPIGGIRKYQVTFEGATLRKPLVVGPALIEEAADRLKAEGLVYHSRLINDVLNAIVNAYIRRGRAVVKAEIESPGFYLIDNKLVAVGCEVTEPDRGRLREALELLNELAEAWFKHVKDKFATIVKWFAIAPFSYTLKQRGRWLRWLYLYGDSATGKTTLGRIGLRIWGLDSRFEKTGASIDTPARFGYVVSSSTFPVLINEPGNALGREDIVEMLKNAVDSMVVRGKYVRGTYVEYPALAPLIFTSNKYVPRDDALLRRMYVIMFSYGEKIPVERQAEFREKVEPRLQVLSEVGKCIAKKVAKGLEALDKDPVEAGKELLVKCYELAGLQVPQWLGLRYEEEAEPASDIVVEFRERLKKYVNDIFARYVSRLVEVREETGEIRYIQPENIDLEKKLKTLLEKDAVVGVRLKEDRIVINKNLLVELGLDGRISLKSLAEMLGWEYSGKYAERVGGKLQGYAAVIAPLEDFMKFITTTGS